MNSKSFEWRNLEVVTRRNEEKVITKMDSPAHWNAWPGSQDKSYFLI